MLEYVFTDFTTFLYSSVGLSLTYESHRSQFIPGYIFTQNSVYIIWVHIKFLIN